MDYLIHILILINIYIILASSLNLLAGYTGLLSICHAAFYGVGAYTAALMSLQVGTPFLINLFAAIIVSGLLGFIVGLPSLHIRGDHFIIATFAFQVITYSVMNNWISLTGGPIGLSGIPRPSILGWEITSYWEYLVFSTLLAAIILLICLRIVRSPFGRVMMSIREDETFTLAAGKNISKYKVLVFIIASIMASIAGVLYAHYISYIDPTSFTVMESIFVISIVIIGGSGSIWGPVVGAVVLVVLPEALRIVGMPNSIAANLRQMLYGVLLVIFMLWRPQGLIGKYRFKLEDIKKK